MDMTQPETWPERYRTGMMIRTFATEQAAMNLLRSWVRGKCYGDEDGDIWLKEQTHRNIADMEVVAIQLHLPN